MTFFLFYYLLCYLKISWLKICVLTTSHWLNSSCLIQPSSSGFDPEIADRVWYYKKNCNKFENFGINQWENLKKLAKLLKNWQNVFLKKWQNINFLTSRVYALYKHSKILCVVVVVW